MGYGAHGMVGLPVLSSLLGHDCCEAFHESDFLLSYSETQLLTDSCSPGRFYASAVMKVIMGQILLNYKCELITKETRASRVMEWRSTILPRQDTMVSFTPY